MKDIVNYINESLQVNEDKFVFKKKLFYSSWIYKDDADNYEVSIIGDVDKKTLVSLDTQEVDDKSFVPFPKELISRLSDGGSSLLRFKYYGQRDVEKYDKVSLGYGINGADSFYAFFIRRSSKYVAELKRQKNEKMTPKDLIKLLEKTPIELIEYKINHRYSDDYRDDLRYGNQPYEKITDRQLKFTIDDLGDKTVTLWGVDGDDKTTQPKKSHREFSISPYQKFNYSIRINDQKD